MKLASRLAKERVAWFAVALSLSAGSFIAGSRAEWLQPDDGSQAMVHGTHSDATTATDAHADDAHAESVDGTAPGMLQTAHACRAGAYLEADRILGSLVGASLALPADTPPAVRTELDSILYTGLQQAKSEVHCVAGVLTHGYDRAYAETIEKAVVLARQRKLSKDVVAIGEDVIVSLRANRLMAPGESGEGEERKTLR